jgi:hypothetical protein
MMARTSTQLAGEGGASGVAAISFALFMKASGWYKK